MENSYIFPLLLWEFWHVRPHTMAGMFPCIPNLSGAKGRFVDSLSLLPSYPELSQVFSSARFFIPREKNLGCRVWKFKRSSASEGSSLIRQDVPRSRMEFGTQQFLWEKQWMPKLPLGESASSIPSHQPSLVIPPL